MSLEDLGWLIFVVLLVGCVIAAVVRWKWPRFAPACCRSPLGRSSWRLQCYSRIAPRFH